MNADQAQQLVRVMAQLSSNYQTGSDASPGTVDWEAVLAQAPAILNPAQVESLKGVAQMAKFESLAKQYTSGEGTAGP